MLNLWKKIYQKKLPAEKTYQEFISMKPNIETAAFGAVGRIRLVLEGTIFCKKWVKSSPDPPTPCRNIKTLTSS